MTNQLNPTVYSLTADVPTGMAITEDSRFKSVALLNAGQSTLGQLTAASQSFSVWLKRQSVTADINFAITHGWAIKDDGVVWLDGVETDTVIPAEQWFHLTLVCTEKRLTLYVNGDYASHKDGTFAAASGDLAFSSVSGGVCLYQQIVFDYVLEGTAIQSNFFSGMPTVKQSFTQVQPIDVSIENKPDGQFAGYPGDKLFIVDAVAKDVIEQNLVVTNIGSKAIHFSDINQANASIDHHHFELKFRNGVFAEIASTLLFTSDAGWVTSAPQQNSEDNGWSIYFIAPANHVVEPGQSIVIPFSYRTVDGSLGERGTYISLRYHGLLLEGRQALVGDRNKQIDILNLSSNNVYITKLNEKITETDTAIDQMETDINSQFLALGEKNQSLDASISSLDTGLDSIGSNLNQVTASLDGDDGLKSAVRGLTNSVRNIVYTLDGNNDDEDTSNNDGLVQVVDGLHHVLYEEDNGLIDTTKDIDTRLKLLDTEVDTTRTVTNKRIEDLEAGDPVTASVYTPQGVVCGVGRTITIYIKNRTDKALTFGANGEIVFKFPFGSSAGDLSQSATNSGNCSQAVASETGRYRIFTVTTNGNVIDADTERSFTFSNVIANSIIGNSAVSIELKGLDGYQTQQLSVIVTKTTRDIAPFVGAENVGVGTGASNPYQKLDVRGNSYVSGSVGIGSSNPIQKLDVRGNGYVSGNVGIGSSNPIQKLDVRGNSYTSGSVGIGSSNPIQKLDVRGNSYISGKVGVGMNPVEKLDVHGTARAHVFKGHGIVPIGTIIDWYRASTSVPIPSGWRVADGSNLPHSSAIAPELRGKRMPDLRGRFVRGEAHNNFSGYNYGGSDSHSHSHNISTDSAGSHNHNWLWYSSKTISTYTYSGSRTGILNWGDGHDTGGSGYYSYTWRSFHDGYTNNRGSHSHPIRGGVKSDSTLPRYVGLLKLMRVL